MNVSLTAAVPLFLLSAAIGVFASVTGRRGLLVVFKPLTTLLLFAVVGWPQTQFAWLVTVGIMFSLGGDVALLFPSKQAFLVGLALFLVAHLAYIVGFIGVARLVWGAGPGSTGTVIFRVVVPAAMMAVVTPLLLRRLWAGASGMRPPLVGYALALAVMVVSACAAVGGAASDGGATFPGAAVGVGVGVTAAAGAVLFYVSDASLAIDRFSRPIKYTGLLTLGLYWLGQLGIALAARPLD